jgi:serine/threonine protein kinase
MSELKLQQSRLDGRYDIQECLGRGSYAEIYVARDLAAQEGDPRTIVIKALNVYLQGDPDADLERTLIANFQNEAIALDRVRHPNIISRLGHGTAIDLTNVPFHYLVLEYMPGGDMGARCRRQPYSLEETLSYLKQICSGLAYAHSKGVIHRDIKPQNLLLSGDGGTVKIADFGVAKLEASEGIITRVGTNVYAPPEHNPLVQTGPLDANALHSAAPQLTPAADIYSLAKTTYTLLLGEPPRRFAHNPITELPPQIALRSWAPSLLKVLERATQNSPLDRYHSIDEFWEDLNDVRLPPTQVLDASVHATNETAGGQSLAVAVPAFALAPPKPDFDLSQRSQAPVKSEVKRPRIVVALQDPLGQRAGRTISPSRNGRALTSRQPVPCQTLRTPKKQAEPARIGIRLLVALLLTASFAGMLLATHYYISHRHALVPAAQQNQGNTTPVGAEALTSTDVNLRDDASLAGSVVGRAEKGSRVKILTVKNNSIEVQVLQHGRVKTDSESSDRGWLNRRYLEFNQ